MSWSSAPRRSYWRSIAQAAVTGRVECLHPWWADDEGIDAMSAARGERLGAGEILLTSLDTDGVTAGIRLRD